MLSKEKMSELFHHPSLSLKAKALYAYLTTTQGEGWLILSELKDNLHLGTYELNACIKDMHKHGLIEKKLLRDESGQFMAGYSLVKTK